MKTKNKDIFGMIFFTISVLVLGYMLISPLNHLIVNIEEYFTLTIVNFPISNLISITSGDFNPPLYYLLAKLFAKFFGGTSVLFSLKILSIIPYLLILIVSATKIRSEYGWLAAGLFGLSIAVMSEFFTSFLMARMYSWGILFTVLAFIYFKDIMTKKDLKSWVLFTIFAILGAYTHYYILLTLACLYLFLIVYIYQHNRAEIKYWGISLVSLIILYSPWILTFIHQFQALNDIIPKLGIGAIIETAGYFAYSGDVLFSLVCVFILAIIGLIYYMHSKKSSDEDQLYILSGFGAYILTIVVGIIVSSIFKPVLMPRFLIFASAILWLVISIMVSKINDKKLFLISFILVVLLLVSGIGNMIVANSDSYNANIAENDVFNQITQSNDSIVILSDPKCEMYFLNYAKQSCEVYCVNQSYVYGQDLSTLHKLFDFKDLPKDGISNLTLSNTDKDVYLISRKNIELNSAINKDLLVNDTYFKIFKLNVTLADETYY